MAGRICGSGIYTDPMYSRFDTISKNDKTLSFLLFLLSPRPPVFRISAPVTDPFALMSRSLARTHWSGGCLRRCPPKEVGDIPLWFHYTL